MIKKVPNIWKGATVWIFGGGPSITEQFEIPVEIVKQVKDKTLPPSVYEPYFDFLKDQKVIGINMAYQLAPWFDIIFFGDNNFFLSNQKYLKDYPSMMFSCASKVAKHNWVRYVPKDHGKPYGITENPTKVSWNQNSGAAAISLAVHLGAKRIFLLGFDMDIVNASQHWHTLYLSKKKWALNQANPPVKNFQAHLMCFPLIAKDAKRLGIEIINVSPNSKIKDFPRKSLKEIKDEFFK